MSEKEVTPIKNLKAVKTQKAFDQLQVFSRNKGKITQRDLLKRKKSIDDLQTQIQKLQLKLSQQADLLRRECHHPPAFVSYITSEYTGEDEYGRMSRWTTHYENFHCSLCGETTDTIKTDVDR